MTVNEFSEKYKLSTPAIHVAINQGFIPKSVLYVPEDDNVSHVDEAWFLRRKEFNRKVTAYIQDMYFLVRKVRNESQIAKAIGVSLPFINHNMWMIDDRSILSTKLSPARWKAFRWFRRIERTIAKRWDIRFNISEILDNEAGVWEGKEEVKVSNLVEMVNTIMVHQNKTVA